MIPRTLRFPACAITGVICAAWSAGFLLHLVPIEKGPEMYWWELPWLFTVIFGVVIPILVIAASIGSRWDNQ